MRHESKPRLLVFVIAYCAEETLKSVLEQIPRLLFEDYHCEVLVVDDASHDRTHEILAFTQDLDEEPAFHVKEYEYLLLLDVIEHLKSPERFLERLRTQFDYSPKIVILSTPNIAFVVQRAMLALGQFNYGKAGILDRTHTRLFTFRSLGQLLADTGFRIRQIRGVPGPFPKVFGEGILGKTALAINQMLIRISPTLFSYQIFVVAEATPDVEFVLDDVRRRTMRGDVAVTN